MAQGQATKVKKKKKSVLKRAAQSRQRAEVNRANRTRVRSDDEAPAHRNYRGRRHGRRKSSESHAVRD